MAAYRPLTQAMILGDAASVVVASWSINMTGNFSFECTVCGHNIVIDERKRPKRDAVLSCRGCGHEFGEFSTIRDALVTADRAEFDETVSLVLGKKPLWE